MPSKKEAMVHLTLRLPKYVVDHYKQYPSHTRAMRNALIKGMELQYSEEFNAKPQSEE
tara:strand:+ start:1207 stop:1380 length:174 start_codon:yes stop_codon:yes gene_type:complete